jgi:hypothetical protein
MTPFRHTRIFGNVCGFAILLLAAAVAVVLATTYARPPKPEEIAKVWIGFDSDELVFTRLDLRRNSVGSCARVSPADTVLHEYGVHGYRITNWSLDGWNMKFSLSSMTTNAEPIYLHGRYNGFSLRLEVGGTTNNWKRDLVLYRESRIDAANLESRKMIEALERK